MQMPELMVHEFETFVWSLEQWYERHPMPAPLVTRWIGLFLEAYESRDLHEFGVSAAWVARVLYSDLLESPMRNQYAKWARHASLCARVAGGRPLVSHVLRHRVKTPPEMVLLH
jgi:hypothetical protein